MSSEFCPHFAGGSNCVRKAGHESPHLYRCAGRFCPGMPWPTRSAPHPTVCNFEGMLTKEERESLETLRRGEPLE